MASPDKESYRMKSYKNKALNPQEMRRRREEEGIQLRKQKREEQVCHNLKVYIKGYMTGSVSVLCTKVTTKINRSTHSAAVQEEECVSATW